MLIDVCKSVVPTPLTRKKTKPVGEELSQHDTACLPCNRRMEEHGRMKWPCNPKIESPANSVISTCVAASSYSPSGSGRVWFQRKQLHSGMPTVQPAAAG